MFPIENIYSATKTGRGTCTYRGEGKVDFACRDERFNDTREVKEFVRSMTKFPKPPS